MEWKMGKNYRLGNVFYLYKSDGIWWIRFFRGWGAWAKNTDKHRLLFSERNGYSKFLRIGKWIFKILEPPLRKGMNINGTHIIIERKTDKDSITVTASPLK